MPDAMRGASSISPDRLVSATARPLRGLRRLCGPLPMPPAVPSSTSVFHSPQASHLPPQRGVTLPQDWQMNCMRDLAKGGLHVE